MRTDLAELLAVLVRVPDGRSCFRVVLTGHVAAMPGRLYEIRFPNGDFEMSASRQHPPPAVGDVIDRRGMLWKVVSRTFEEPFVVRVEPVPDRGKTTRFQAPGGG